MNITILDFPISNIPYIFKVPSTSLIIDQFPMDSYRNIYMISLENEDSSLESYAIKIIRRRKKLAGSSSVTLTLDWRHPSAITSFDKHHALLVQSHLLLETNIHHHEVFSTITPEKPSKFGQLLKGPDRVIGLSVPLHNILRTVILVSSLLPFPVITYPAQPASSDLF